jgi:hypothetical protein
VEERRSEASRHHVAAPEGCPPLIDRVAVIESNLLAEVRVQKNK